MSDQMPALTNQGMVWIDVPDPIDRSLLGGYWNAVHRFRDTGDDRDLGRFAGLVIAGYELQTDLDEIEFWAYQGQLDFVDIYEGGS
jgi:hypothetical protein